MGRAPRTYSGAACAILGCWLLSGRRARMYAYSNGCRSVRRRVAARFVSRRGHKMCGFVLYAVSQQDWT
jgi:hypothetical protein